MGDGHRHHDMGGRPAGAVTPDEHRPEQWELEVDAMMWMLSLPDRQVITIDRIRRIIEDMAPDEYDGLDYYERWTHGLVQALLETGTVTPSEIGQALAAQNEAGTAG